MTFEERVEFFKERNSLLKDDKADILVGDIGCLTDKTIALTKEILSALGKSKVKVKRDKEPEIKIGQIVVPMKNGTHNYTIGEPCLIKVIHPDKKNIFNAFKINGKEGNRLKNYEVRLATEEEIRAYVDKMTWEYVYIAPKKAKAS